MHEVIVFCQFLSNENGGWHYIVLQIILNMHNYSTSATCIIFYNLALDKNGTIRYNIYIYNYKNTC